MHSIDKKLFKQVFGDITLVPEKFSKDALMKVHAFEWLPVIYIAGSYHKIQNLSFVIDNQVKLEAVEPTERTLPLAGNAFKGFVLFLTFNVTTAQGGGINERDARTFAQAHHFYKYSQWNAHPGLQFHKTVI